jgi:hypothetical protein
VGATTTACLSSLQSNILTELGAHLLAIEMTALVLRILTTQQELVVLMLASANLDLGVSLDTSTENYLLNVALLQLLQ